MLQSPGILKASGKSARGAAVTQPYSGPSRLRKLGLRTEQCSGDSLLMGRSSKGTPVTGVTSRSSGRAARNSSEHMPCFWPPGCPGLQQVNCSAPVPGTYLKIFKDPSCSDGVTAQPGETCQSVCDRYGVVSVNGTYDACKAFLSETGAKPLCGSSNQPIPPFTLVRCSAASSNSIASCAHVCFRHCRLPGERRPGVGLSGQDPESG